MIEEFRKNAHQLVDWIADYYKNIESYPVKSMVQPGDIFNQLPTLPPEDGEDFQTIFQDFESTLMKGVTHWQHPSFFAYFNANTSFPSILGEFLTAALGAQCMSWETSPSATELEEMVCIWLKKACGLPDKWEGVIQDSGSSSNLCGILAAREKYAVFQTNLQGLGHDRLTVYCSEQTHSSIDKAVRIAGIGSDNLRKIPVDNNFAMIPAKLSGAIHNDRNNGYHPLCVIGTIGTTGSNAVDPMEEIGKICTQERIWLHIDAAHAGTAAFLPEKRKYFKGIEYADSYTFNPHKWMFTNFDCSLLYVKNRDDLTKTFSITPEYLKTEVDKQVKNYRDWGIPLGRRFRALKLWFVIRSYGMKELRNKLREHTSLTTYLLKLLENNGSFRIQAPVPFNLLCFQYVPDGVIEEEKINTINKTLLSELNRTGKVYLTHTILEKKFVIRACIGQTYVKKQHVDQLYHLIVDTCQKINIH